MKSRETVIRRHIFSALYCSNKVTSTETLVILNSPQLHLPHFKLKLKLFFISGSKAHKTHTKTKKKGTHTHTHTPTVHKLLT